MNYAQCTEDATMGDLVHVCDVSEDVLVCEDVSSSTGVGFWFGSKGRGRGSCLQDWANASVLKVTLRAESDITVH